MLSQQASFAALSDSAVAVGSKSSTSNAIFPAKKKKMSEATESLALWKVLTPVYTQKPLVSNFIVLGRTNDCIRRLIRCIRRAVCISRDDTQASTSSAYYIARSVQC